MSLFYYSTRNKDNQVSASQAILKGIAEDGGLYVPNQVPHLPLPLQQFVHMPYQEVAFHILKSFLTDFTDQELKDCIAGAYNREKFDTNEIVPIKSFGKRHYLELFHGETIAFKDMALSILPYLMRVAAQKEGVQKDILILTATSGDTGKAAMAGFADVPNTKIIVFYPKGGVSHIQERQMLTQTGNNTHVIGIKGNFDDAQTAVKQMFTNAELKEQVASLGYQFSSANSINIGRLTPQIAYYVYGYAQLVKKGVIQLGDPINVSVPTGNFGNILAAYYAKEMGLPIKTFICASNKNKVLTDFFQTGTYNKNRPFYVTNSPSMDILVSSNLERLIFMACQNDDQATAQRMQELIRQGQYAVNASMKTFMADFYAGFADEDSILSTIQAVFKEDAYLLDPHTAVAEAVYQAYQAETGDQTPTLIASTASPYKFPASVMAAFGPVSGDDFDLVQQLENLSGVAQPAAVSGLRTSPIRHNEVVTLDDMVNSVLAKLK